MWAAASVICLRRRLPPPVARRRVTTAAVFQRNRRSALSLSAGGPSLAAVLPVNHRRHRIPGIQEKVG
ncbi:hypothetical protein LINPERHAP2_LOCUS28720 [Linum perenne]